MENTKIFKNLWVILLACISCNQQPSSSRGGEGYVNIPKQNIILINADDLGYGDLGCYGATGVYTPNIDNLASQGCSFTDFHSCSAVCSPSRYGLMTGRYPSRVDLYYPIFARAPCIVDTSCMTIAKVMKQAGYATAAIGKWHLGFGTEQPVDWNQDLKPGPLELGFDYYFGIPIVNSHPPFVYVENHQVVGLEKDDPFVYGDTAETQHFQEKFDYDLIGGARKAHSLYVDRMIGTTLKDTAITWIKKNKEKPFFLYLATTNIHHPFTPAERFVGTSQAGRYGDFIHELDWIVGEVMKTLDEEGLSGKTLLILTSDNGGMLNQGGQDAWKMGHHMNSDRLLGFKFDAWEGGNRVPFVARWPGKIKPGTTSNELLSNVDLLATFAAITGYILKDGEGPDSYNGLPALLGTVEKPVRDFLVISPAQKKNLAIRKGKWMYISSQGGGGFTGQNIGDHGLGGAAATLLTGQVNSDIEKGQIKPGAPRAQLYNLEEDLAETRNLYHEYPRVVEELEALLHSAINENESTRPQ